MSKTKDYINGFRLKIKKNLQNAKYFLPNPIATVTIEVILRQNKLGRKFIHWKIYLDVFRRRFDSNDNKRNRYTRMRNSRTKATCKKQTKREALHKNKRLIKNED